MKPHRRRRLRGTLFAVGVAAALAAPGAEAALLPPSLAADSNFAPPSGVARFDFYPGNSAPDLPHAIARSGDRTLTVGQVRATSGDTNIAVVARKLDGTLDTSFAGDGSLELQVAAGTGTDIGSGIAVLPDGRIRIAGTTDQDTTQTEKFDGVVVGLLPDGSLDPEFGGYTADGANRTQTRGIQILTPSPGTSNDERFADLAIDPASGRIAVAGARSDGGQDDLFAALLEADGKPVPTFGVNGYHVGVRSQFDERITDVLWRPGGGGFVTLVEADTNGRVPDDQGYVGLLRAYNLDGTLDTSFGPAGTGEVALEPGVTNTRPTSMILHKDRFYVTGRTRPAEGNDNDAFLARLEADGGGQQSRRFDLRGAIVPTTDAPLSTGLDLDVVPGVPDTLVVVGSTTYTFSGDRREDWAAGAFNDFEGDLAAANFGDLALDTPNRSNQMTGIVATGPQTAIVAGTLDAEPVNGSVTVDTSIGHARLLTDSEKRCDLTVRKVEPLELVFANTDPATATFEVRNVGTRPCAGTLDVPAPFAAAHQGVPGPITTPLLTPGDTFSAAGVVLAYFGPRPAQRAALRATVAPVADTDVDTSNNAIEMLASFNYCDVGLTRARGVAELPNEGALRVPFQVRNRGTIGCGDIRLAVGGRAAAQGRFAPFALTAGRGATSVLALRARGARVGRTVDYTVLASTSGVDVDPASNTLTLRSRIVRVGSSRVRRTGARRIAGRAAGGRGSTNRRSTQVRRVQIAIQSLRGNRCSFVPVRGGRPVRTGGTRRRGCATPTWITTRGTTRWNVRLQRALPPGRYAVRSRTITRNGFAQARFSAKRGNLRTFRVR